MPHDNATTFGDLMGNLDLLCVAYEKCGHAGRYRHDRLIEQPDPDGKILDFLANVFADCPRTVAGNISDLCAVKCPDLPRVL